MQAVEGERNNLDLFTKLKHTSYTLSAKMVYKQINKDTGEVSKLKAITKNMRHGLHEKMPLAKQTNALTGRQYPSNNR